LTFLTPGLLLNLETPIISNPAIFDGFFTDESHFSFFSQAMTDELIPLAEEFHDENGE